jgi:hypothetical protein
MTYESHFPWSAWTAREMLTSQLGLADLYVHSPIGLGNIKFERKFLELQVKHLYMNNRYNSFIKSIFVTNITNTYQTEKPRNFGWFQ